MTRVIIGEDCGNSPKNIFLEKLTIAFARGDSKFILDSVTEDIYWNIVGARRVEGKAALAEALHKMKNDKAVELTIHHVATHGKAGAVDGKIKRKDGSTHAFCDVYEFHGARATGIRAITSYVIEIK